MKKIIGGKVYNTDTAECMADEDISLDNFYSTSEALYVTATGNWFLHGESSAGGAYSHWSGDSCGYGEDIIPLTVDQVIAWAERADIDDDDKSDIAERLNLPEA